MHASALHLFMGGKTFIARFANEKQAILPCFMVEQRLLTHLKWTGKTLKRHN